MKAQTLQQTARAETKAASPFYLSPTLTPLQLRITSEEDTLRVKMGHLREETAISNLLYKHEKSQADSPSTEPW